MNVRLAANVLSHTMGSAIRTYAHYKAIPSATAAALFVEHVNDMFDLCNNNNYFNGISADNLEDTVLKIHEWINWLDTLRFYRRDQVTGEVSNVRLVNTSSAFSYVSCDLKVKSIPLLVFCIL